MGNDLQTAGKTSALRRLLQEGQAVSESELIFSSLKGEMHFVQLSTDESLSLLWLYTDHPCLADAIVQGAPLVIECRHDITN